MLEDKNSLVRNRGLVLIAHNARWDIDRRLDRALDTYLAHILDEKPITARQCAAVLPEIAEAKPELVPRIRAALEQANLSGYSDSMQPLILKDIAAALEKISTLGNQGA